MENSLKEGKKIVKPPLGSLPKQSSQNKTCSRFFSSKLGETIWNLTNATTNQTAWALVPEDLTKRTAPVWPVWPLWGFTLKGILCLFFWSPKKKSSNKIYVFKKFNRWAFFFLVKPLLVFEIIHVFSALKRCFPKFARGIWKLKHGPSGAEKSTWFRWAGNLPVYSSFLLASRKPTGRITQALTSSCERDQETSKLKQQLKKSHLDFHCQYLPILSPSAALLFHHKELAPNHQRHPSVTCCGGPRQEPSEGEMRPWSNSSGLLSLKAKLPKLPTAATAFKQPDNINQYWRPSSEGWLQHQHWSLDQRMQTFIKTLLHSDLTSRPSPSVAKLLFFVYILLSQKDQTRNNLVCKKRQQAKTCQVSDRFKTDSSWWRETGVTLFERNLYLWS